MCTRDHRVTVESIHAIECRNAAVSWWKPTRERTPHKTQAWKPRNTPLSRGAGTNQLLFLDAYTSGVAGDMLVAALLDLGVPLEVLLEGLRGIDVSGYHVHIVEAIQSGIVCPRFAVHVDDDQPFRDYATIRSLLKASTLPPVAEADVHGMTLEDVHFHEVGAVDSIVDIVAAALALDHIGADRVVCSPLPMGRGVIRGAAHGPLPGPPPAVVGVLCGAGLWTVDGNCDQELVTPTAVAHACSRWPAMKPLRCAYGSGTRTFPDRPNVLRVLLSQPM